MSMFDEIRYELNSVKIDCNRNVGITSTIKNYDVRSMMYDKTLIALNAEWNNRSDTEKGHFNFVPLNMLLGFCEDYKRSPWIDFNTSAQRLQLLDEKFCDGAWDWIIQSAVSHVALNEVNKLSSCDWKMIVIWAWIFACGICTSILCYRIRPSIGCQNGDSIWEAMLPLLCRPVERMSRDVNVFDDCNLNNVKVSISKIQNFIRMTI